MEKKEKNVLQWLGDFVEQRCTIPRRFCMMNFQAQKSFLCRVCNIHGILLNVFITKEMDYLYESKKQIKQQMNIIFLKKKTEV